MVGWDVVIGPSAGQGHRDGIPGWMEAGMGEDAGRDGASRWTRCWDG